MKCWRARRHNPRIPRVAWRSRVCDATGMFRCLPLLLAVGLCALGCGADKTKGAMKGNDKVLATIDGQPITNADLEAALAEYAHDPYIQARYTSPEKRKQLLDDLIIFKVMVLEAKKMGLENDPEVRRVRNELLAKAFIEKEINGRIKASDIREEDIATYYQSHRPEFTRPEEIRISQLMIADESKALKLARQARALPPADRTGFSALVAAHSEDEDSKDRGGDSLFFNRLAKQIPPTVLEAAFALKTVGDVAGPIATPKGFFLIQLSDRRISQVRSLPDCANEIRARLLEKARMDRLKAIVEEEKKHTKIEIFHDVLAKIPPSSESMRDASAPHFAPIPTPDRGPPPGSP